MLLDQIDNSFQYQILPWHRKPDVECFCNIASDVMVKHIAAPRSLMPIDDLPCMLWCHVASGHPKDTIHDNCQIYDVAHNTTNVLWAIRQKS